MGGSLVVSYENVWCYTVLDGQDGWWLLHDALACAVVLKTKAWSLPLCCGARFVGGEQRQTNMHGRHWVEKTGSGVSMGALWVFGVLARSGVCVIHVDGPEGGAVGQAGVVGVLSVGSRGEWRARRTCTLCLALGMGHLVDTDVRERHVWGSG